MIRTVPNVGDKLIISKNWFASNQFFTQYLQLQPSKVYEVLQVDTSTIDHEWGIVSLKDIMTDEIYNIDDHPELEDYWCIFNAHDEIRFVEQMT